MRRFTVSIALVLASGLSCAGDDVGLSRSSTGEASEASTTGLSTGGAGTSTTVDASSGVETSADSDSDSVETSSSAGEVSTTSGSSGSEDTTGSGTTGSKAECEPSFRYAWYVPFGNTLVKIDTTAASVAGEYDGTPGGLGFDDALAVAPHGDIAAGCMIVAADPERCPDPLQTSIGLGDIVDGDGCVRWTIPQCPRTLPLAWTPGTFDAETCQWQDVNLWALEVVGGFSDPDTLRLLDGDTGDELLSMAVEPGSVGSSQADPDGNLWTSSNNFSPLTRVTPAGTLDTWAKPEPSYLLRIGPEGNVWTSGGQVHVFDPVAEAWLPQPAPLEAFCAFNLAEELWCHYLADFWQVDPVTFATIGEVHDVGVSLYEFSVDDQNNLWILDANEPTQVWRYDPSTAAVDVVDIGGTNSAAVYGDRTGAAAWIPVP